MDMKIGWSGEEMSLRIALCLLLLIIAVYPVSGSVSPKPVVGVYYFPGWYRTGDDPSGSEWRSAIMKAAKPRALCGFYDDSNPDLWRYYREWMIASGINFIAFDWYYNAGQDFLQESLHKGFMAQVDPRLRFCIHWCNHGGSWWEKPLDQSEPALLKMTDLLCERYFHRSDYLKMNGKPVLMIYSPEELQAFGGPETVRRNLQSVRERVKKHGFPDLYLVAIYPLRDPGEIDALHGQGYDAFTAYTYAWVRPPGVRWDSPTIPYPDLVNYINGSLHPFLSRTGKQQHFPYWPTVFPGWDDRPRAGLERGLVLTGNTPDRFGRMLKSGLRQINPESPVVMIEAWNEWGEGACIEPSKENGFGFLKEIARLTGSGEPEYQIPTPEEIASWSVLAPEELTQAQKNESKPWPVREIIRYKFGKNREIPNVRMPVTVHFNQLWSSGKLQLSHMEIHESDKDGVVAVTTGTDPHVDFSVPEVPVSQIRRITIEAEVLQAPARISLELFLATALMPEFNQAVSTPLPAVRNGRTGVSIEDFIGWGSFGTPLTRMRLDPGSAPGARIRLKRVILSGNED